MHLLVHTATGEVEVVDPHGITTTFADAPTASIWLSRAACGSAASPDFAAWVTLAATAATYASLGAPR